MSSPFAPSLLTIGDMLVDALATELQQQGHSNTGKLMKSIVHQISSASDALQLNLYFEQYGAYIDKGVAANRIPYTPGSGRKSSRYINALMLWATQRGFVNSQRQAKSMAFAIARKHSKEGMPGRGANRLSLTGSRTGFFSANPVFNKVEEELHATISLRLETMLEDMLNSVGKSI